MSYVLFNFSNPQNVSFQLSVISSSSLSNAIMDEAMWRSLFNISIQTERFMHVFNNLLLK